MPFRLPLALALVGLVSLSACDSGADSDDITGTWSTTLNYQVDSLLADQNYRVVADYTATYTFELLNEDGLIYGRVTSSLDGTMTGREAGREPVVYTFSPEASVANYVFGTYDDPVLELDVPWGPYENDLWTFEKIGGRAELDGNVVHQWTFDTRYTTEPGDFTFVLDGKEKDRTEIRRTDRLAPVLEDPSVIVPDVERLRYESARGNATLSGVHVEAR